MAPSLTRESLKIDAFVKFPLCAHAKPPEDRSAYSGWIFFSIELPVVEYLT